ncbi:MAG TPA: hypothetical protein VJ994_02710 [Paracoccaceae bacterium]|nr:hypothetical protein [Paracoccaceae bacterium]
MPTHRQLALLRVARREPGLRNQGDVARVQLGAFQPPRHAAVELLQTPHHVAEFRVTGKRDPDPRLVMDLAHRFEALRPQVLRLVHDQQPLAAFELGAELAVQFHHALAAVPRQAEVAADRAPRHRRASRAFEHGGQPHVVVRARVGPRGAGLPEARLQRDHAHAAEMMRQPQLRPDRGLHARIRQNLARQGRRKRRRLRPGGEPSGEARGHARHVAAAGVRKELRDGRRRDARLSGEGALRQPVRRQRLRHGGADRPRVGLGSGPSSVIMSALRGLRGCRHVAA